MTRIFIALLILAIPIVYAIDDKLHAPSGSLILDAKNGSFIKAQKPLRVNKIENASGTAYPPSMLPIGGAFAVMPNVKGAWKPPVDCTTVVDGFVRAGYNGSTCTVPLTCNDCIIPKGTTLPNMNNETYPRGGDASVGTGGANSDSTNVSVNDHQPHQHSVTSNVSVVGTNTFVSNHTHTHSLEYNKGHDHSAEFTASSTFTASHSHEANMLAGFVGDILPSNQNGIYVPRLAMSSPSDPFFYDYQLGMSLNYGCSGDTCHWIRADILTSVNEEPYEQGVILIPIVSGTDGSSFSDYSRKSILRSHDWAEFTPVLIGDTVVITAGTYTINGTYIVVGKQIFQDYDELTLDGDINTGSGYATDVTFAISGIRGGGGDDFRGIPVKGNVDVIAGSSYSPIDVAYTYTAADRTIGGTVGGGDTCDGDNGKCRMNVLLGQYTTVSEVEDVSQSHAVSNPDVNNEPKYMSVIWVIRVK